MRLIAHILIGEDKRMWDSDVSVVCEVGIATVLPRGRGLSLLVCCAEPRCRDTQQVGTTSAGVLC